MNHLLVSVIIPVHNCDRYLAEAIDSVLAQTYRPLEIIVVDDGSTDDSAAVAKGYTLLYEYQPKSGAGAARNRGAVLAQGEFLAFLDADDRWEPDKLHQQMAAFSREPDLDAVFGYVQQFHSPELPEADKARIYCPPQPMAGYSPSAMLLKRKTFFRVGLFETHLQIGEFVSWYARAIEMKIRTALLPDLVAWRRLHQSNTSLRRSQSKPDFARLLKASIDRRRALAIETNHGMDSAG